MDINLFNTTTEELSEKLVGTTWEAAGLVFEVKRIYLDQWRGQHCAEFTDNSWAPVTSLVGKATQLTPAPADTEAA